MGDFDTDIDGTGSLFLDEFGETVTYHPNGGSDREITAIVYRQNAEDVGGSISQALKFEIEALNDTTDGIGSSEIDVGGDFITAKARLGGSDIKKRVLRIVSQDSEMMRVEIQ